MRVLIATFVILIIVSTLFADGIQPEGSGTQVDPYRIDSLDNLLWLGTREAAITGYYIQTTDINAAPTRDWFDGTGFLPIGESASNPFSGNFDGQGYVIDSLYINNDGWDGYAMFRFITEATIRNVNLTNVDCSGEDCLAGLTVVATNSFINNCHVDGNFSGRFSISTLVSNASSCQIVNCSAAGTITGTQSAAGGLISEASDIEMSDCSFNGTVNGYQYAGGLIGFIYSSTATVENCTVDGFVTGVSYVGGIVGSSNSDITDCVVHADVEGVMYTGGILGYSWGVDVSGCATTGNVKGETRTGGIIGCANFGSETIDCRFLGTVYGTFYVGGINGESVESDINDSYINATVTSSGNLTGGMVGYQTTASSVNGCFAKGVVSSEGNSVGGIVGWNNGGSTITNCYNFAQISGNERVGGITGRNIVNAEVHNCYSKGLIEGVDETGGLVGFSSSIVENSFWDTETSGQEQSSGGTGLSTEDMLSIATYLDAGWDFIGETDNGIEDIWTLNVNINEGYPYLTWQNYLTAPEDEVAPPVQEILLSNYPNPFNPTTTISFSIPKDDKVELKVYNIRGQLVKTLVNDNLEAGKHEVIWNGKDTQNRSVGSGVYLYRLEAGGKSIVRKMLMLK